MPFSDLNLTEPLLRAVAEEGYAEPTPIQAQAVPHVLAGRDLCGIAQTGTGKTAAFALPILQLLAARPPQRRGIRVLVLAPTRELAAQIQESFVTYGRHSPARSTVIFGGVGQDPQVQAVRRGIDVLVATPGRLLDLMQQGHVHLNTVEILVLDEADRMLDMGFIHDVRRIIAKVPTQRQTLFFSATMPDEVVALSRSILTDPARVEATPVATTAEKVEQRLYFVEKDMKRRLLVDLLRDPALERVLVFTRTKHGADRVAKELHRAGIGGEAIHGNKGQGARERALRRFKDGDARVLVATDIAARGIDVDGISHVVNFDLPNIPETYVHRIGRTARAGAGGMALSFCDQEEREYLRDIERLIRAHVPRVLAHDHASPLAPPPETSLERHHRSSAAPAPAPRPSAGRAPGRAPGRVPAPRAASPQPGPAAPAARPSAPSGPRRGRTFGNIRR